MAEFLRAAAALVNQEVESKIWKRGKIEANIRFLLSQVRLLICDLSTSQSNLLPGCHGDGPVPERVGAGSGETGACGDGGHRTAGL